MTTSSAIPSPTALHLRPEQPADYPALAALLRAAFLNHPHGRPGEPVEPALLDALRQQGGLTLALTAEVGGQVVGHIAFSPVCINGASGAWYGMGPLAVLPERQRQGIGSALVEEGLRQLRAIGAQGCVLVGEPDYYRRFGFAADPLLLLPGVPPEYFLVCPLADEHPVGEVSFHAAFALFV
jgi:putative acetyltransferase